MQVTKHRSENATYEAYNVWMTEDEKDILIRHAPSYQAELALRLMARSLRVGRVPHVRWADVHRTADGEQYRLRVEGAKGDKVRDVPISDSLERDMYRFFNEFDADDQLFPVTKRTAQRWVKQSGTAAAVETGVDDFRRVSAHDLRRWFAHHTLVVERVNPRVVMEAGGWETYAAIEPYLNKPTEEHISEELVQAGLM